MTLINEQFESLHVRENSLFHSWLIQLLCLLLQLLCKCAHGLWSHHHSTHHTWVKHGHPHHLVLLIWQWWLLKHVQI